MEKKRGLFHGAALLGLLILLVFGLVGCGGGGGSVEPIYDASDPTPLKDLADLKNIKVGAAVFSSGLTDPSDPNYPIVLAREYNMLVAEWEMKFDPTEPSQGNFYFEPGDALVEFARAHNMIVRGHCLIWHQALPDWVKNGSWTKSQLLEVLRNHISGVVGHYANKYPGIVRYWDVVNEAISDSPPYNLRSDSIWTQVFGNTDFIDAAFNAARAADPSAKLFYNDYGGEGFTDKATAIYNLVKGMKERGIPIDGVGFQMHIDASGYPLNQRFAENIKRFTDLGLEVQITEMDVRIPNSGSAEDLNRQAQIYHDVMAVCLQNPKVTAFLTWGFTDRHSWIPGFFTGYGRALPFDENYNKKQAYYGLQAALKGQ